MNIPPPTRCSVGPRAFTLIELLVVITIIAVLAGLLLPVVGRVQETARKTSAKSTESQIVSAVTSYQTEYGQYPVLANVTELGPPSKDTTVGFDATTPNQALFDVLRAINSTTQPDANGTILNSRRIVYFESKNVKNAAAPRDGFIPPNTTPTGNPNTTKPVQLVAGDLVDPWGNMYIVRYDTGYTNAVVNPYSSNTLTKSDDDDPTTTSDASSTTFKNSVRTGVIALSYGNDGIAGSKGNTTFTAPYSPTPGDDVASWQ